MSEPLSPGTKLGRYEIRAKIGAGGMGEVYLAFDTDLDRTVAIKILPEALASNQQRLQRFIQEAKAASALNHPHILTIHEIGTTGATRFIATEFIDGDQLRTHIVSGMKPGEILEVAIQAGGALATAHAAGIIHRDIKPENIMIRRDGYVKVLDFGLAKLTEPTGSTTDNEAPTRARINTDAGTVMGTANYMAPEQAKGAPVDARTDLWSLGVVIYEMVTGQVPFAGETPTETISLILQRDPAPLTRFANDVPGELERIVSKALTKDREARYQTAKDMLIDLRNLKRKLEVDAEIDRTVPTELRAALSTKSAQSSMGTASSPAAASIAPAAGTIRPSSAEYLVSEIKKHKIAVAVISGLAVLALVGGIVGASWFLHARNSEVAIDSIAVLPFENQDPATEYLSDGVTESIINNLTQLPSLRVTPRSTVFYYKGQKKDPLAVGKELGVRAVLTGRLQQRGDDVIVSAELIDVRDNKQLWGEHYQRKISDLLAMQSDLAKDISAKLRPTLSGDEQGKLKKRYTDNAEAYQLYLKGRYFWLKFTPDDHKKAGEYFNQAIAKDPGFALAYAGLGDTYGASATNGWISPREGYPKAKIAVKRALEIDDTLAEAHTTSGAMMMFYDLDWTTAEREYKRAIELNPNYEITYEVYSYMLSGTGRLDEGIAMAQRGLQVDPLSVALSNDVGGAFYLARRYDEAIRQYQKSIELDPNDSGEHLNLGEVYELKGMHEEAIKEFQIAIGIAGRTSGALGLLGHAYAAAGKQSDALRILDELKGRLKNGYVSPWDVAVLYIGLGDKDRAFAELDKAYDDRAGWIMYLKVEPILDPLRSDPRFAEMVSRMKFPK